MRRDLLRRLAWWQPPCLRDVVIVNRIDDPRSAIRGVLWQSRGTWLVVTQAELLTAGQDPTPIDGQVLIQRSQVAFLQRLPVEGEGADQSLALGRPRTTGPSFSRVGSKSGAREATWPA